jgi:hypothetical protein
MARSEKLLAGGPNRAHTESMDERPREPPGARQRHVQPHPAAFAGSERARLHEAEVLHHRGKLRPGEPQQTLAPMARTATETSARAPVLFSRVSS